MRPQNVPVTMAVIAICVIVFAIDYLQGGALTNAGAVTPALVKGGEWWLLITGGFLHASVPHILFNMLALFQAGTFVEFAYGSPRYALIYVAGLIAGNLAVTVLSPAPAIGASGAIMGVFGAMVVLGFKLPAMRGPLLRAAGFPILLTLANGFINPYISWQAHVGGLLGGALVAQVLTPARASLFQPAAVVPEDEV
ncbi:MAG TPA: rhomboid family intramembrane serine protease [Candidatus Tumulicola sp.]|nr:rhomboid family intramembrane serine protease [Candidatus Tumulicola sp.]